MSRARFSFFFVSSLLACGAVSAQVNIINVANGDVTGLKAAINTANGDNENDIINLATNGTYTLTTVDNPTGGANGLPVIGPDNNHSVTIHGHGSTITRSGSTAFRFLQMAANSNVFIDNLTISNALIANFGPGTALGAGIYNNGGALTLTTCTFTSNIVQGVNGGDGISLEPNGNNGDGGEGGAINSTGALTVTGCTFTSNSAVGGKGGNGFGSTGNGGLGGTGNGGAILAHGSPITVASCIFTGNSATGGNGGNAPGVSGIAGTGAPGTGGAIYGGFTDTIVTKCVFNNSSATAGQSGTGSQFGNVPGQSFGGALDLLGTITESTLTNNTAQNGGALSVEPLFGTNGTVTAAVAGCLFQNNSASIEGGAIHVTYQDAGILGLYQGFLMMSNCTVSGCSAPHAAAVSNSGQASLFNCTLDGNNSSAGGAGSLETNTSVTNSNISLRNSILKTGTTGANVASNAITSQGHNISSDNAAGLLTATGDKPNTDPFFVSDIPQDNGGPTKTIAIGILGSSPAINAGDDGYAPHRDQRGYFRTGQSDIGAYEYFGGLVGAASIVRSGGDAVISAELVYGHSYILERKMNLSDSNWQPVGNEFPAMDNDIESETASGDFSLGRAFYHIRFTN